ncbi:hypothetical protein ACFLXA_01670 [Chloroflexota bacterium]
MKNIAKAFDRDTKVYAVKAKKGLEIQNQCAEIKLRAERRAGEILASMEKHPPGPKSGDGFQDGTELPPKLSDLGIDKHDSHRWQLQASVPVDKFEQYAQAVKEKGGELASAGLQRFAIKEKHGDIKTPPLPEGVFDVIYADPPWQ